MKRLRTSLIELLADIEAGLDFVDEDIEFISPLEVQRRIESAAQQISLLLTQIQQRRTSQESARVALVGLPNAGKSSLLNAIVGRNVAIVNEQAGTTRDYLRVTPTLRHGIVEWIDTAGMEDVNYASRTASISSSAQAYRAEQLHKPILSCSALKRQGT